MKIIVVVLLIAIGLGIIGLAPMVNEYVGDSTFGVTFLGQEYKASTTLARVMQVVGGLMILGGLMGGLVGRMKNAH